MTFWILVILLALATTGAPATQVRDDSARGGQPRSSISGLVMDDSTPSQPVRRVIVTLSGATRTGPRSVMTDDSGRFMFSDVVPGSYNLFASRPSYVTSAYGAKRPGRPGMAIVVPESGNVANLVLLLWRGATVSGVFRDELGRPAPGVSIAAIAQRHPDGRSLLTLSNNGVLTNDLGEYRIFGLEPGDYLIKATPSFRSGGGLVTLATTRVDSLLAALARGEVSNATTAGANRPFDITPVFFPGTPIADQATHVSLQAGERRENLDFSLVRVPAVAIDGTVTDPDGRPAPSAVVQLTSTSDRVVASSGPIGRSTTTSADGGFRFTQVPPGEYRVLARSVTARSGAALWSFESISVSGGDVSGLALQLNPGTPIRGRIVFQGAPTVRRPDFSALRISLSPPWVGTLRPGTPVSDLTFRPGTIVAPDGTFELRGVLPATYRFEVTGPGLSGVWFPKSALLNGRDLFDGPTEIASVRQPAGELEVIFSDRTTELAGTVRAGSGGLPQDIFVVAFPVDEKFRTPGSRRIRAIRPGVDGQFSFAGMPSGDYLLGAVTDVDTGEWEEPNYLKTLAVQSIRVTLGEGQRTIQDLQLGRAR